MGTVLVREHWVCWVCNESILEATQVIGLLEHIFGLSRYPFARYRFVFLSWSRIASIGFRTRLRRGTHGHGIRNLLDPWRRPSERKNESVNKFRRI